MAIADSVFGDGNPADAIDDAVRPYGLIGLTIGLVLILALTAVLILLGFAAAAGVTALVVGWPRTRDGFFELQGMVSGDVAFAQRLNVVVSIVTYVALSASVLAAARWRGGSGWREILGLRPWHPFRGDLFFWVAVVLTIVYSLGADALIGRYYPPSRDWISLPHGALWTSLFIVLAVVFAPIAEELLFRGWLYTGLRRSIGVWAGIVVTAILFALAHWEKSHLYALGVFPVGVMLGVVRERTASLKASMTFHALYNGAASLFLLFGS